MDIIIVKDAEQAGQRAADIIESTIWQKLDAVLGFATGSSPLPFTKRSVKGALIFQVRPGSRWMSTWTSPLSILRDMPRSSAVKLLTFSH